jgi:steroid delta-isomerase-like uncharacterized protein
MTTEALIRAYFERFNAGDAEGLLGLLSDDVIHDINEGPTEVGIEAFRAFKAHMDRSYREQITDLEVYASGDKGAAEFTCSGEYLATDSGLPEAAGQRYSIWAGAFFTVRDGKICRITSCYNLKNWIRAVEG